MDNHRNGRKQCPRCERRGTEKTGRFEYCCLDCGHEWTDEEAREQYRENRRQRRERRIGGIYL